MKKIIICIFILVFIANSGYSQRNIFIEDKSYVSLSEDWKFEDIEVGFAKKTTNSGFIFIYANKNKFKNQYMKERFSGTLYLYLDNGKQIILSNKVASDDVDTHITAVYLVNSENLNSLFKSNIVKIRYGFINEFDEKSNFTVANIYSTYKTIEVPAPEGENMSAIDRFRNNITEKYHKDLSLKVEFIKGDYVIDKREVANTAYNLKLLFNKN